MPDIENSFDSDVPLKEILTEVDGPESGTLYEEDYIESENGDSTYTYTGVHSVNTAGDYTFTLTTAENGIGDNGAGGVSSTVTVDSLIPDSVVLQYAATTYSGGEPTWSDDTSTENMDLTGGETAETLSDGSDAVGFDGTDDIGLYTVPSALEGPSLNSFAIEYVFQMSNPNNGRAMGCDDSGSSQRILIEHEKSANFDNSAGNAVFLFTDQNGNRLDVGFNTSTLDDGTRHDITINVNDLSNNDVDVIIDGNTQNVKFGNAQNPSSFTTWADQWGWGYENKNSKPLTHNVGAIRFHDSPVTSQTIGDYPF